MASFSSGVWLRKINLGKVYCVVTARYKITYFSGPNLNFLNVFVQIDYINLKIYCIIWKNTCSKFVILFPSKILSNKKSHRAFLLLFWMSLAHYLNHFQTSKLSISVIFDIKIRATFLFLAIISFFQKYVKVTFSFVNHLLSRLLLYSNV